MFTNKQIWNAIDLLAESKNLSLAGLARAAGLDVTIFNFSKRKARDGRPRWPSTESLSKMLMATGTPIEEFAALLNRSSGYAPSSPTIPLIGMAQAGTGGYFDDAGFPVGGGWEEINFPKIEDENAYALEVNGDSMEPVYRQGDILIVSPNANCRRGDRVVAKTFAGQVMFKTLKRQTAKTIELSSFNPEHQDLTFELEEMDWVARVLWVSQ
jgi:phage repressor protein C with HTH and peptisase S24 domain